jgi:hypothetical protein
MRWMDSPFPNMGQSPSSTHCPRMDIALDPSTSQSFDWGSRPGKLLGVELIYRDLTEWAKHGVLLLNTSLTVRAHEVSQVHSYLLSISSRPIASIPKLISILMSNLSVLELIDRPDHTQVKVGNHLQLQS